MAIQAAGVTFVRHNENYLRCADCNNLVSAPGCPYGVDPEDHICSSV